MIVTHVGFWYLLWKLQGLWTYPDVYHCHPVCPELLLWIWMRVYVTRFFHDFLELLQDSIWDVSMFGSLTQSQESQSQVTSIPEEDGRPSLFAGFEKQRCNQAQGVTSADEVTQFLAIHSGGKKVNAVRHWQTENRMLRLRRVALQFLSVPASSAPVERVFSTGGHILSARRGSMAADTLTSLMVLKCNKM